MHTPCRRFYLVAALLISMTLFFTLFQALHMLVEPKITHNIVVASLLKNGLTLQGSVRIMPLGDSITAGEGSTDGSGYRAALWKAYQAAGNHVDFVGSQHSGPQDIPPEHEGHPGWRIDQLASHITDWLAIYQPHIILLHIGTNDILQNRSLSTAPARLDNLIERITEQLPTSWVIVAQITPLGKPLFNVKVMAYNSVIPLLVQHLQQLGKHVTFVDIYDAVPVKDLLDGIHPNDAGYAQMAAVWYKATAQIL
ncbi:MAG TPA: SGNH/GDSL hydrolase family protein [Ktedonosporobacter sp.]|nr:SGNH/GDSL hydrolase family protein [Ktedonosporobacter sp.]